MMTIKKNNRMGQEIKLQAFLEGANGNTNEMLIYCDWLEETGSTKAAEKLRKEIQEYAEKDQRGQAKLPNGETWLIWYAKWNLICMAEGLVGETAFQEFHYYQHYSQEAKMQSLEYNLVQGFIPTLQKGNNRQNRLGRIIETLGYSVFWLN